MCRFRFVVCHHNIFHRGTKETLGQRRIMLKVSVDRTRNPARPSWRHERLPVWSAETVRLSPWVPAVFCWMAGAPEPEPQPEPERERARLLAAVLSQADSREQARAAWRLARTQHPETLSELLGMLAESAAGVSPEAAAELPPDAREVRLATTIAAFGEMASAPVCARLGAAGVGAHERALLLDVLLDCGVETERHACCFAEAAQHADDWVRHNALQGLEMTSGGDEAARAMVAGALADPNDMVAFTAVSALFHHDAARGRASSSVST